MATTSAAAAADDDHSWRGGQQDEEAAGHVASPLLGALLNHLPEVFQKHVCSLLDSHDLAMLGRVCGASREAVKSSGLPRAGTSSAVPLSRQKFFGSLERLAWARANDCKLRSG